MWRGLWIALFTGCIGDVEENPCDVYVDYLCSCGVETCEDLRQQLDSNDLAVQDTCRIEHDCFLAADDTDTCVLIGQGQTDVCLDA